LHSCSGNLSITVARNAWVGYSVCFCVMCYGVQESRGAMDGGGGSCIEDGLVEGTTEASIKREYEEE
jgi:hypothetical protein